MFYSYRPLAAFAAVLLFGFVVVTPNANTAPPKGGGAPPPGKILYSYDGSAFQMNGDGSGKTQVDGYASGHPSRQTYNGHRWWIRLINGELWATPDGITFLQVTNMLTWDNGDGTMTVFIFEDQFAGRPTWSNAGDSFISASGTQFIQFSSDPIGQGPYWGEMQVLYRFPVSAAELEARYVLEAPGPAVNQAQAEPVAYSNGYVGGNLGVHHWSPDGTELVYGWGLEGWRSDVWVAEVGPGVSLPINAATAGTRVFAWNRYELTDLQWSPQADTASQRILVQMGNAMTIRTDGSDLITLFSTSNTQVRWSPDGQHVAYRRAIQKGLNSWNYQLYRMPGTGGTAVLLTGDLDRYLNKYVLGWGE